MPSHWGNAEPQHRHPVEPDRQPVHPGGRLRRGGRYIVRRPAPAGLRGPRRRAHLRAASARARSARASSGRASTRRARCTCPCCTSCADNGFAISVPAERPAPGAGRRAGARASAASRCTASTAPTTSRVRDAAPRRSSSTSAPASGPALHPRRRSSGPYSHSAADTQTQVPLGRGARRRGARTTRSTALEAELVDGGVLTADEAARDPGRGREVVAEAARRGAGRGAGPTRLASTDHVVGAARPRRARRRRPTATDGRRGRSPFGEAIRRTLHEQMAADERIRVFGEDVADAREARARRASRARAACSARPTACSATFGQARCFNTPLSEANIVGRAVGQALRGLRPAPEIQFFDYIWPAMTQIKSEAATIRWRSNGAFTLPDGAAGADRRLPHRRRRSGTASAASRSSPTCPGC